MQTKKNTDANGENLPRGIRYLNDERRKMRYVYERRIDGKRVRTFFSTREAAIKGKEAAEEAMKTGADGRKVFNAAEQREYEAVKKIIGTEESASLIDVAIFWREHADLRKARQKTVLEVATEVKSYIARRNVSHAFMKTSRVYIDKLARRFGSREISTIKGRELTEWILSLNLSPTSIAGVRGLVSYFFRRACALEYISRVPAIDKTLLPKVPPVPVSTLTAEEAKRVLFSTLNGGRGENQTTGRTTREFLANIALRLFCGLRAAEAARMQWEWIDEERKRIIVPAKICKTRDDWVLQYPLLPDTVFRWLACVPASEKHGIIPAPSHEREQAIFRAAGMEWKRNALRHTFCTMHVSLYDSADKTALLLKHRGTAMLYKHYLAKLVPKEEAEAYFAISPC